MKSLLTPLARSLLLPFGLSAAMSATDAAFQKNIHGSGITASLISNEEMEGKMKMLNLMKNEA